MPEILVVLLILLMIAVPIVSCGAFGYTILQPMALAIHGKKLPIKFYVADFFSLSFLVAIPLVFVRFVQRAYGTDSGVTNFFSCILVGMFAYIWWRGTAFLSGMGVIQTGRRCVFLGILMPIAIVGSAFVLPALFLMFFRANDMERSEFQLWLLGVVAMPLLAWGCRQATYWVLSDPNIPKTELPPEGTPSRLE